MGAVARCWVLGLPPGVGGCRSDGARVWLLVGGGLGSGVCLLFENCIVDASIFVDCVDRFVW